MRVGLETITVPKAAYANNSARVGNIPAARIFYADCENSIDSSEDAKQLLNKSVMFRNEDKSVKWNGCLVSFGFASYDYSTKSSMGFQILSNGWGRQLYWRYSNAEGNNGSGKWAQLIDDAHIDSYIESYLEANGYAPSVSAESTQSADTKEDMGG